MIGTTTITELDNMRQNASQFCARAAGVGTYFPSISRTRTRQNLRELSVPLRFSAYATKRNRLRLNELASHLANTAPTKLKNLRAPEPIVA
jgi:hypothetical protein